MATPFDPFVQFFPTTETQNEAEKFAEILVSDGTIQNLWHLSATSVEQLKLIFSAVAFGSDHHFSELVRNFSQDASDLWNNSQPIDPNAPTPAESRKLAEIWTRFFELYSGKRRTIIRHVVSLHRNNNHAVDFKAITRLTDGDFKQLLDDHYHHLVAQYYLENLRRFILSNQFSYKVVGRVVDQADTDAGVQNVRVSITDKNDANYHRNLGYTYTDNRGYFSFRLNLLEEPTGLYQLNVRCQQTELGVDEDLDHSFNVVDESSIDEIEVTLNVSSGSTTSVSDVLNNGSIGLSPSTALSDYISNNNIQTLRDIREMGGLKNQGDIPDAQEESVLVLDALANLELINSSYENNYTLYSSGITNISQVATTPRSIFVRDNGGIYGDFSAAQTHYMAQSAYNAVQTMRPGGRFPVSGVVEQPEEEVVCGCSDCQSAVSPLAYYADLLHFTLRQIFMDDNGEDVDIDLSFLTSNFHMPFGGLKASCTQLNGEICQNRLAVEVLRSYYSSIEGSIGQAQKDALELAESNYLELVYRDILTQLGTSYEELRMVYNDPDTEKQLKLTDRIGIVIEHSNTTEATTLKEMHFDLSEDDPFPFDEEDLETIFGLRSSLRDPLTDPNESKLSVWKKAYLRDLWQAQDYPDNPYFNNELPVIDPDIVTVDDIRDLNNGTVFQIWENRLNWIQDRLDEAGSEDISEGVTIGEIFSPLLGAMSYDGIDQTTYGSKAAGEMWSNLDSASIIPDLKQFQTDLSNGNKTLEDLWGEYRLNKTELDRILKLQKNTEDSEIEIEEDQFELLNLRTEVAKRYFYDAWRDEEKPENENVKLGPDVFHVSLESPKVGHWPIKGDEQPIIEPQLISRQNLTEISAYTALLNADEKALYENRVAELEDFRTDLDDSFYDNEAPAVAGSIENFENMLSLAFDVEALFWDSEDEAIGSYQELLNNTTNPATLDEALDTIQNTLYLTLKDFQFLMSVGKGVEDESTDDLGGFSQADWTRLYDILLKSHKQIKLYPDWVLEEAGQSGTLSSPLDYWKIRKAQLPVYRSSVSRRKQWERALKDHSSPPIIDAAMLRPADLLNYTAGTAYDLLLARHNWMFGTSGLKSAMNAQFNLTSDINDYRTFLDNRLGLPEGSLQTLIDQELEGKSISGRLKQMNVSSSAFRFLYKIEQVLVAEESITEGEQDEVHYIVINALKERESLNFKIEEWNDVNTPVTLSQDFFRYRKTDQTEYPVQESSPLKPWLSSEIARYQWRRKLKSRIEQEKSIGDDLKELLFSTDENLVHVLRDAIIVAVGDGTKSLPENARFLGDRFLIDLENNCCFKTNRIAMALEVLQQLHWKIRIGDIFDHYPDIRSRVTNFESVWQWMGNYGNWRAAMFVFLYPENLMIPGLRKKQTPGFKKVIEATRNNRRFNPDHACHLASEYQEYLREIQHLELKCAARAEVITGKEGCNPNLSITQDLVFHFAESGNSEKCYYTITKPMEENAPKQLTFWTEIPSIPEKAKLIGTDVYIHKEHEVNHIYLFYLLDDHPSKFFALRFDLNLNRWETTPLEFEITQDDLYCHVDIPLSNLDVAFHGTNFDISHPWVQHFVNHYKSRLISKYVSEVKEWYDSANFINEFASIKILKNQPSKNPPKIAISLWNDHPKVKSHMTFHQGLARNGKELSEWSWHSYKTFDHMWLTAELAGNLGDLVNHPYFYLIFQNDLRNAIQYASLDAIINENEPDLVGKIDEFAVAYSHPNSYWGFRWLMLLSVQENVGSSDDGEETQAYQRQRVLYRNSGDDNQWRVKQPEFQTNKIARNVYSFPHNTISGGSTERVFVISYNDNSFEKLDVEMANNGPIVASSFNVDFVPSNRKHVYYSVQTYPGDEGLSETLELERYRQLPFQLTSEGHEIMLATWTFDGGTDEMTFHDNAFQLTPSLSQVGNITKDHTNESLDIHAGASAGSYLTNLLPNQKLIEYVKEAHYFVPMQIALQLTATGHYVQALDWFRTTYDYTRSVDNRKIYYGLVIDEEIESVFERSEDWYEDPLNPHAVAGVRQYSYTKFTILSIVQCILAYADAEFTADTSETVPRARELYEMAFDLLQLLVPEEDCPLDKMIADFPEFDIDPIWEDAWNDVVSEVFRIGKYSDVEQVLQDIETVMSSQDPIESRISQSETIIHQAIADQPIPSFEEKLDTAVAKVSKQVETTLAQAGVNAQVEQFAGRSANQFAETMHSVTGHTESYLEQQPIDWLSDPTAAMTDYEGRDTWPVGPGLRHAIDEHGIKDPNAAFNLNSAPEIWLSGIPGTFCSAPNPIIEALWMHAHVNLFKIRNCMNIAGMVRELSPFSAPTDATSGVPSIGVGGSLSLPVNQSVPPSAYRYKVLVERAKQLVSLAQQLEGAFLTALEKFDAETYSAMRAEQDIESSRANIKLQDLKVKESESNVELAELQKERAQKQVDGLQGMIDEGLLDTEMTIIQNINQVMIATTIAQALGAAAQASAAFAGASIAGSVIAGVAGAMYVGQSVAQGLATRAQSQMQINQLYASFARREQEWNFQKTLAEQDVRIGGQQIKIANDRLRITGQEREMAQLQNTHAQASLDFLKNKFTSAELYEFMSGILEDVYQFFLMEATAVAKMAENQLAFERQIELPPFIRSDYWVFEDGSLASGVGESESPDRRGITGSARLLKDLYELDQHGFMANTPRLKIIKNISLNQLDPVAMQELRDTGKFSFITTKAMFDRDYPGHYLRLIKGVNVSVIALTPPVEGIRATLTNTGISRVITGGNIFQERVIARQPEEIILSNPNPDRGMIKMQAESEFLAPFEGSGVDTQWEFRMEKPANPFDFSTIADIIFTIEYEATSSTIYRQTVLNQLNNAEYPGSLVLSFKNNLPDQWYELHNPVEGEPNQMSVSFDIGSDDLLVHTNSPQISSLKLYVAGDVPQGNGTVVSLALQTIEDGELQTVADGEKTVSDQIRLLDYSTDTDLPGNDPTGRWTLSFPNYNEIRTLFEQEKIDDIILVINYNGLPVPYTS